MSITHKITETWNGGSATLPYTQVLQADGEDNREIVVPASTTNQHIVFSAVRAKMVLIFLVADQNLTIKTNNSGSPADTISLVAGVPFVWFSTNYLAQPFTADITQLYATNATLVDATLDIRLLVTTT